MRNVLNNSRGISLIEVLIVAGLAGLIGLAVSRIVTKPVSLVENLAVQIDDVTTFDVETNELISRLQRSQPMRRGFFTCDVPPSPETEEEGDDESSANFDLVSRNKFNTMLTRSSAGTFDSFPVSPIPNAAENGQALPISVSFAYSEFSTLVALESQIGGQLSVVDTSRFNRGALLILSSVDRPNIGGVFRVLDVDPENAIITVSESSAQVLIPPDFGCRALQTPSLSEFTANAANQLFGKRTPIFRAELVRLANYRSKAVLGNKNRLVEKVWPVYQDAAPFTQTEDDVDTGEEDERLSAEGNLIRTQSLTNFFEGMTFSRASWDPDGNLGNGTFEADVKFILNRSSSGVRSTASAGDARTSTYRRTVRYSTRTGGRANFAVADIPPPNEIIFPGCGLTVQPLLDGVQNSGLDFASFFSVRGNVSGGGGAIASMNIEFIPGASGSPDCWYRSSLIPGAGGSFLSPVESQKLTAAASIIPGSDELVCRAPASGSAFKATLSMFSVAFGGIAQTNCSADSITAIPTFAYQGGVQSSCSRADGSIQFGNIVIAGTNQPGPSLFVTQCNYSTGPDACGTPKAPGVTLESVQLLPTNIPGVAQTNAPMNCI